ncbi:glycoside hydrolase family 2 protein [Serendipita vermifera MAFF 305830]|uniref:Beta-mannosidase B n=1 Tax=Serendipita vermifera MAFF 305830 TaxID=933852 RepID=A0A0C3B443_SERVB|nr:glycoside hydrolase family 2 protein [Serendipita vermifera MAFF 305830]
MTLIKLLDDGWSFTQLTGHDRNEPGNKGTDRGEWLPVKVPTGVHEELLKVSRIPDPFIGLNEHLVQWIGEEDWAFRTKITITPEMHALPHIDLILDGLDTYATVEFDGTTILETNNMFVPYRADLKRSLGHSDCATEHSLHITFHSTFLKGRSLQRENADKTPVARRATGSSGGAGVLQGSSDQIPGPNGELALWNGDASRLHVRKAQYHYGWDWGPILMCVGPWKPVHLEAYKTRIVDMRTDIKLEGSEANITARAALSGSLDKALTAIFTLVDPSGKKHEVSSDVAANATEVEISINITDPKLWYPVGQGQQHLYNANLAIADSGSVLATSEKRIGLRTVRIVQKSLEGESEGGSFYFEVNGASIFAGGSNWIPADSFLTNISPDRYRAWLQLLVDGNQNMIRVWGGGIYEHDVFYDICDELGILVWQDFLFGCGQYPAYEEFLGRVSAEVEANVKRLRHHPSIVIWAGNNEDYALAESIPLELDYSVEYPKVDFRDTSFPARYIYEVLLPEMVAKHAPDMYYHRGSPYSGSGKKSDDRKHGDIHQWNVWHGSQEPWHNWDILAGRFISEFGMQGYPDLRTVDYWIGNDRAERYPQSRTMNSHNKADGFERRLELYLMENFKHAFDIESYVYYTQIMQAETLASAYRLWRREWRGPGKEYVGGALVWQLNDCWPVTSWAIADYFLRPKPAYFTMARELAPFTVGMTRKAVKKFASQDSVAYFTISSVLEIWGTNAQSSEKKVCLELHAFDVEAGTPVSFTAEGWNDGKKEVTLAPNASTELWKGPTPGIVDVHVEGMRSKPIVVQARLVDVDTKVVLARYSNWPEPFKYIHFPTPAEVNLKIVPTVTNSGELQSATLSISVDRPIKGLVLDVEGPWAKFSDQAIDMFPGDTQIVGVIGLDGRDVKARYLGDGTA